MMTDWRVIAEFPAYEVSSDGDLRRRDTGAMLHPGRDARGYLRVTFSERGKKSYRYVHRLVALAFLGPEPAGAIVCHINGRTDDPRAENLRYGNHRDNRLDAVRHGTAQRSRAHLTPDSRRALRAAAVLTPARELAERFGVSLDYARLVRRRAAA